MHCISKITKGALFAVVSILLFNGCHPSPTPGATSNEDDFSGYASDASRIEWVTDDAISIADAAGFIYNGTTMRTTHTTLGTCCTVGTDTISLPHTLTIRFGPINCTCQDGRARRGTIIVSYSGHYTDTSKIHTISFDHYFVNDNEVSGYIKTTRKDTTVTGNWYYKVLVNDSLNMSQDPLNSKYVVWTGNLVRKWISGYVSTLDRNDDAWSVSGNTTLTRPNGHQFSCDIATPLAIATGCDYAESGVIDVTGYLSPMRVLNFGSGGCDNAAVLNIGTNVYNIDLVK